MERSVTCYPKQSLVCQLRRQWYWPCESEGCFFQSSRVTKMEAIFRRPAFSQTQSTPSFEPRSSPGPKPSLQAGKVSLSRDFHWTNSIVVGVLIKIYISAWQHECLEAARISKKHRRSPAMTDPQTSMSPKVQLKENRFMRSPVKNIIATSFTGV